MRVEANGNTTVIRPEATDLSKFLNELLDNISDFTNSNLVVDILTLGKLTAKDLSAFSDLAKQQKKNKKSFVIVADTDYNRTGKLVVVPTVQEAHDMIEMDEIERDLGF